MSFRRWVPVAVAAILGAYGCGGAVTGTKDADASPAAAGDDRDTSPTPAGDAGSGYGMEPSEASQDGPLPSCTFNAKTFDVNGAPGYALQDVQGTACTGNAACTASIAGAAFCGLEAARLDEYRCVCADEKIDCTLVALGDGIATSTWCDCGPGSNDAG